MSDGYTPILSATVESHRGRPALMVNGRAQTGLTYMTYAPKAENFTAFDRAGVRVMSFTATSDAHLWPHLEQPVNTGPGQYDYSPFDARMKMVADAAPHSWLLPRVYTLPPPWWCQEHPDDLVRFGRPSETPSPGPDTKTGQPVPSFASSAWRQFASDNLARLVAHVQQGPWSDRVLGYHIASGITEEWIWWGSSSGLFADYSPVMQAYFRAFLRERYKTDQALQGAWHQPAITLATAQVPPLERRVAEGHSQVRHPDTHQDVADYILCHSDAVAGALCHLAHAVKAALASPRLVIAFYGYMANFGHQTFLTQNAGHLALEKVLNNPDVDGLTSPSTYIHRGLDNGYSSFMDPVDSIALHGKLWFDENDHKTHLPEYQPSFGATHCQADTLALQRRQFAAVLEHSAAGWWFEMGGNWYDPAMHAEVAWSQQVARRALSTDRASAAEVALVWDPKSVAYMPAESAAGFALGSDPLRAWGRSGVPFDTLLLCDLPKARDYKLYVFLNAWHLFADERAMIERSVHRDGKTALWIYAAGYLGADPSGFPAQAATTGVRVASYGGHMRPTTIVREGAHPIVAGLGPPRTYGLDGWLMSPFLHAEEPDAIALGFWESDEQMPLLVARDMGSWRSIWSSAPNPPSWLVRRIARYAGAHVYCDSDDAFYTNRTFVALSTGAAGPRTIHLLQRSSIYELSAPNRQWMDVEQFEIDMPRHHTAILFLGSKQAWEQLA